jgi:diguanylate cyclase (GGDEF)-like protein
MSDTDKESMLRIMERLRLLVCATPVDYDGRDISVTASFGGAFAAPVNDMRTATRHADKALYRAKEEGRNRAVFFEEEGADPTLSANPRTTTQPCP